MAGVFGNLDSASPNRSNERELIFLNHTARSSSKACAAPCATVPQGMRTLIRFRFISSARLEPRSRRKAFVPTVGLSDSPVTREQIHLLNQLQMKSIWRCLFFCCARMALKLRRWRNPYSKLSPKDSKTFTETERTTEIAPR